jgi:chemotaxis protein MotA
MARTHLSRTALPSHLRTRPRGTPRFDAATLVGVASGLGLVLLAMAMGGAPIAFFDVPSILIVVGGTLGVTTACFSLEDMARAHVVAGKAIFRSGRDPAAAARDVLKLADLARRRGILAVEQEIDATVRDPFGRKALLLVVEGAPGDEIEGFLKRDIQETMQRHAAGADVFRRAAEISPGMGLIGTLIGLVQMLSNLDDPATIGPSMAVAILTTFYGAILATMIFTPLAAKLERNAAADALVGNVYMLAAAAIARQEHPRRLENLLNALLPPSQRVRYHK